MRVLKVTPNDNSFFGTGKRFKKGESTWIETKLIPYPSVFYGSICSLMLQLNKTRADRYIGKGTSEDDPREFLKIGNIYLYDKENKDIYIKAPLDLYLDEENNNQCHYGEFRELGREVNVSNKDMKYFIFKKKSSLKRVDDLYITRSSFYNSYYYKKPYIDFYNPSKFFSLDYKVGIQTDKGKAKDEHLYRIDLMQFNDYKFNYLIEYEIDNKWWEGSKVKNIDKGYLKLGGENKSCKYVDVTEDNILKKYEKIYSIKNNSDLVKLYFSSPGIYREDGYIPSFKEDKIKVVGISNSKPYHIGGYDMRTGHKPMYKAITDGSVYLLECSEFIDESIKNIKKMIDKYINMGLQEDGLNKFEVIPCQK
ncbi:type III-B CRISPR module-associated Cmr3 family protein [Wukongibacter sp. M2B1]|uniref:type III-B CRISPR module-associated Cmr3 family protein n=1 Tax=Wukongibacter sp. M2B1 TaxID=3088895 RepID=UPI003D79465E